MTLPDERYNSLRQIRGALYHQAFNPGRVSKRELRVLVCRLMRHFPTPSEIDDLAKACPRLLRR